MSYEFELLLNAKARLAEVEAGLRFQENLSYENRQLVTALISYMAPHMPRK